MRLIAKNPAKRVPAIPVIASRAGMNLAGPVSRVDLRLYDVEANPGGTLTFGIDGRFSEESQDDFDGTNGFSANLVHFQDGVWGGFNKLALQYGQGSANTLAQFSDDTADQDERTYRIVEQILVEPSPEWSGMAAAIVEHQEDRQTWFSIGARPKYHFSDIVAVAFEAGFDMVNVDGDGEDPRMLTKLTLAPMLQAGRGFFARPSLRIFGTFAFWNDEAGDNGVVLSDDSDVFGGSNSGFTFGIQTEVWW